MAKGISYLAMGTGGCAIGRSKQERVLLKAKAQVLAERGPLTSGMPALLGPHVSGRTGSRWHGRKPQ